MSVYKYMAEHKIFSKFISFKDYFRFIVAFADFPFLYAVYVDLLYAFTTTHLFCPTSASCISLIEQLRKITDRNGPSRKNSFYYLFVNQLGDVNIPKIPKI